MDRLEARLFGSMELRLAGHLLPPFPTQKARNLLALLLLHADRTYTREALMSMFWGNRPEQAARKCLRTDLWRIRRILEPEGIEKGTFLITQDHRVSFSAEADHWLDVAEFESKYHQAEAQSHPHPTDDAARGFEEAIAVYRGDLLESCLDNWCLNEQVRLRSMFFCCLERLMGYHQRRRSFEEAIGYGQRLLQHDALREHVHRDVMRFYHALGNRSAALRQFATCREMVRGCLDVEPQEATHRLYRQIQAPQARGMAFDPGTAQPTSCSNAP